MELNRSVVHRNLDSKIKILGFEFFDLLAVAILGAAMNLVFGRTSLSFVMVFVVPLLTAGVLYFGKKDKPENYLIHVLRFYLTPGAYAPGVTSSHDSSLRRKIYIE